MLSRFREFGWLKGLGDGQQHQRVLRARSRYRAGVAIHALVIADPQGDRPQAERLLALVDALAAAVALFFVDDVLVKVVGRIFGIDLADGLARDGVTRPKFFPGLSLRKT